MSLYDQFNFKPFSEMTDEDYKFIGFKSGLEVHQQLLTEKKLFCRCPAGKYSDNYNAEILRHMRPTLSELGEYDGTALMEFKTKKDIIYRINYDTVCTYEMDDTPPFKMNQQALDITIKIAMLLNANIVDEIHISRKQYLDGSIPTGFQRTAIISVGGWVPYKDRRINIIQMSIEEDSCREYSDMGHKRIYLTDRLGMPLIETVTAPDMRTPYEVADVNNILRKLVRTTSNVRTGIGAGRQDVNVSVTGGTRIEIKGVPKIVNNPLLTYNEAMRQWRLLQLRDELHRRGITPDSFSAKYDNITKLLRNTNFQPIYNAIKDGQIVNCVTLRNFRNLLRWETQTHTYFSKEISDRVRVIACLTTLPNIIHSDSPSESLLSAEWQNIKRFVSATEDDTIVLVWGNKDDAETGAKEIIIRAEEATISIPSETRQALRDGTTGFERILPGPQRMYPDTDLPPQKITLERIQSIRQHLPVQFWNYEKWYRQLNLPEEFIEELACSKYAKVFEYAVTEYKLEPKLVATILIPYPKKLRKKRLEISKLTPDIMLELFKYYYEGSFVKDAFLFIMEKTIEIGYVSKQIFPKPLSRFELGKKVDNILKNLNDIKINKLEKKLDIYTSLIMNQLRFTVEGQQVKALLHKIFDGE